MNREEARLILQAFRPGGQDTADPQLAGALALAKTDAELGAWFAEQQKFDAQIVQQMKSVAVPDDLREKILAQDNREESMELPIANWWRNLFAWNSPMTWAMAGCILIVAGLVVLKTSPAQGKNLFTDYQTAMISASQADTNHVEVLNTDLHQVESWFTDRQAQAAIDVPAGMRTNGLMGCRVLDWHGKKVSMLCFVLEGAKHVDLFIADLGKLADNPAEGIPQFAKNGSRTTAAWGEAGKIYLMTGDVDENFLRHCLNPSVSAKMNLSPVIALISLGK